MNKQQEKNDQERLLGIIAHNVAKLRGEATLQSVAEACGTYPANIMRIEKGEHMPNAALLKRLADHFGTSTDALLRHPNSRDQKNKTKAKRPKAKATAEAAVA